MPPDDEAGANSDRRHLYFDDYATPIKDRVAQNGGDGCPQPGVDDYPADASTDSDAYFTVKGTGAGVAFWR